MKVLRAAIHGLLVIALAGVLAAGCSKEASQSDSGKGEKTTAAKSGLSISIPKTGSLPERIRALWATTLPIIKADASAGLSEDQYQARRLELFSAWVTLQQENANAAKSDDKISRGITRILELIDHVYGFPGSPAAERTKDRQNTGRTDYLISDIEKEMQTLPK